MAGKNTILLISDNEDSASQLEAKLIFLRAGDNVLISDFKKAFNNLELSRADIVLVQENSSKKKTVDLIKKLHKTNRNLCIILIANSYDSELILASYDAGISDFALSDADAFELVIRIVNNIKHNSVKMASLRNEKILEQLSVIDDLTGLYNYNYAQQVIENIIDDNLLDEAAFMAVAPSQACKNQFSVEKMAAAILSSIRVDDTAALGRGAKFFVFMPDTDFNGAVVVLNKIKENYGSGFELCAGISDIAHKNFEEMKHDAVKALSNALATEAEYVFAQEKNNTLDEWLEDPGDEPKNYKIFRQIFNKKMEQVITPVFYRLQKVWEEKFFNTEIEQYTNNEQCVFRLKNKKQDSTLRIVYPGFAKIVIYQSHEGLDSPENREIQLPLTKVTQKELVAIVENFIKDFKYTSV